MKFLLLTKPIISILFLFLLCPATVYSQQQQGKRGVEMPSMKIGVVDIQRVIEESKKGKDARKYFEGLFSLRTEEELAVTEQELISQIIKDIEVVIEDYAKKEGYTHVIDMLEGGVVYSDKNFDITDKVITIYDKRVKSKGATESK